VLKDESSERGSPAVILYIVMVQDTKAVKTLLGVQRLKPVLARHDPFSTYPLLHISLYSSPVESATLEFVAPDLIKSHFASLEMQWEGESVTAVTSLDRG
jgi:hypothetical protein